MTPAAQALFGVVAVLSGAGSICLFVIADQSRDEPETFRKATKVAHWLVVVCVLCFIALWA